MSIKATNHVRSLRGLSPSEKAVAFVLADHANVHTGDITASMSTVAVEAGLAHRQTASNITARLVRKGLLAAQERDGQETLYRFQYKDVPATGELHPPATLGLHPPATVPATLEASTCNPPVAQRVEGRRESPPIVPPRGGRGSAFYESPRERRRRYRNGAVPVPEGKQYPEPKVYKV